MSDNRKLGEARLSRTDETSVSADRDKVADVELGAEDVAFAFNLPLSSVVARSVIRFARCRPRVGTSVEDGRGLEQANSGQSCSATKYPRDDYAPRSLQPIRPPATRLSRLQA